MVLAYSMLPVHTEAMAVRKAKSKRGGARPGAGRKPVLRDARSLTFYVEAEDLALVRKIAASRGLAIAEVIRAAVRSYARRFKRRKGS